MNRRPAGGVLCVDRRGPFLGIAEDLVLLGYDPVTGRPRVPTDVLRAVVVGGVLADLFLSGSLRLSGGGVVACEGVPVPGPRALRVVWERVRARPGRGIDHWVRDLGGVSALVVGGLVRGGVLRGVRVRRGGSWWRRAWVLAPAGPVFCRARTRGLGMVLARSDPLTGRALALAGLADAAGLLPVVVHAAGIASVTDLSTITPVRARIRHALHHATSPDLALICATITTTTTGTGPGPGPGLPA